jgi:membrane-associated phospholipid phosphatase
MRATAWGMVAAGLAAPLLRKRAPAHPVAMQALSFAAPLGAAIAMRRSPRRDIAVCALQMWAYLAAYKTPHDDEEAQRARVRVAYPIWADRVIGLGELPSTRLQRALARNGPDGPEWRALDRVLVWAHWSWFAVPHGALLYVMWRRPERFGRAAVLTYAVFDVGASFYWFVPTAPPWYAAGAREDGAPSEQLAVRRMMVEYGEDFWQDGWGSLYSVFGGNPLAAMPSLHFATTLMAALLLAEVGPIAGAVGLGYTAALGFALVYLGEHYVVDLIAGAALTVAVRRSERWAGRPLRRIGRAIGALEGMATA